MPSKLLLRTKKRLRTDFPLLYSQETSEQHSLAYKNFLDTFNIAIVLDTCANGCFLQWEAVLEQPVYDVYTYLQYKYAKEKAEAAETEYQRKRQK